MKIQKAREILAKDMEKMSLEELQKHRVNLLDAWRWSRADHGFPEAVKNGFFKVIASECAYGFSPTDIWLERNLLFRLDECEKFLKKEYGRSR